MLKPALLICLAACGTSATPSVDMTSDAFAMVHMVRKTDFANGSYCRITLDGRAVGVFGCAPTMSFDSTTDSWSEVITGNVDGQNIVDYIFLSLIVRGSPQPGKYDSTNAQFSSAMVSLFHGDSFLEQTARPAVGTFTATISQIADPQQSGNRTQYTTKGQWQATLPDESRDGGAGGNVTLTASW